MIKSAELKHKERTGQVEPGKGDPGHQLILAQQKLSQGRAVTKAFDSLLLFPTAAKVQCAGCWRLQLSLLPKGQGKEAAPPSPSRLRAPLQLWMGITSGRVGAHLGCVAVPRPGQGRREVCLGLARTCSGQTPYKRERRFGSARLPAERSGAAGHAWGGGNRVSPGCWAGCPRLGAKRRPEAARPLCCHRGGPVRLLGVFPRVGARPQFAEGAAGTELLLPGFWC